MSRKTTCDAGSRRIAATKHQQIERRFAFGRSEKSRGHRSSPNVNSLLAAQLVLLAKIDNQF